MRFYTIEYYFSCTILCIFYVHRFQIDFTDENYIICFYIFFLLEKELCVYLKLQLSKLYYECFFVD